MLQKPPSWSGIVGFMQHYIHINMYKYAQRANVQCNPMEKQTKLSSSSILAPSLAAKTPPGHMGTSYNNVIPKAPSPIQLPPPPAPQEHPSLLFSQWLFGLSTSRFLVTWHFCIVAIFQWLYVSITLVFHFTEESSSIFIPSRVELMKHIM